MTRNFSDKAIDVDLLHDIVGLATRSPSAGKTQGWSLLVLTGDAKDAFWDLSLPVGRRDGFAWPGLLHAPVIALSFADPRAYVARYAEPDKAHTGLGAGVDAWQTPYWTIDSSMATMALLLAAHDAGLGALFFAVFNDTASIRQRFGVPEHLQLLGAVALGHPADDDDDDASPSDASRRRGVSAARPRATPSEVIHLGRW